LLHGNACDLVIVAIVPEGMFRAKRSCFLSMIASIAGTRAM
jgi:hypothetical protein